MSAHGLQSDTDARLRETIDQAKDGLTALQRQAFELVCRQGLSVAEAAAKAGCPKNVLSKRLHDARKQLLQKLEQYRAP